LIEVLLTRIQNILNKFDAYNELVINLRI